MDCSPTEKVTNLTWLYMHAGLIYSDWMAPLSCGSNFCQSGFMDSLFDGMVLFVEPKAKDGGIEAIASMRASIWDFFDRDEGFTTTWDRTGWCTISSWWEAWRTGRQKSADIAWMKVRQEVSQGEMLFYLFSMYSRQIKMEITRRQTSFVLQDAALYMASHLAKWVIFRDV